MILGRHRASYVYIYIYRSKINCPTMHMKYDIPNYWVGLHSVLLLKKEDTMSYSMINHYHCTWAGPNFQPSKIMRNSAGCGGLHPLRLVDKTKQHMFQTKWSDLFPPMPSREICQGPSELTGEPQTLFSKTTSNRLMCCEYSGETLPGCMRLSRGRNTVQLPGGEKEPLYAQG